MAFEPIPKTSIALNGESIRFTALEESGPASVFVYAEAGKEGIVYKVLKGQGYYALKVFYPDYQDKRLLTNTEKLNRYRELEGFRVAERTVINHKTFPKVVNEFPELNYSVLMPWIEGTLWGNMMLNGSSVQREEYYTIARTLMRVVHKLEENGLAHCDLSNNNFIIDPTLKAIELIDIEDMYASDMPRPIPDISYGTPGYRTKWIAEQGLWGPKSDRFASAILCAEIVTWHHEEVRKKRAGDMSFFEEEEIGENSERYQVIKSHLGKLNSELPSLFEKAWYSQSPEECPPVADWLNAVENLTEGKHDYPSVQGHLDGVKPVGSPGGGRQVVFEPKGSEDTIPGTPPRMEISHSVLDFGIPQLAHPTLQLVISNTGGSLLTGSINPANWLEVSPSHFSIRPGEKQTIKVSLRSNMPRPQSGNEYRAPNALIVTSTNGQSEVIGANFKLAKPPFYKSWFGLFLIAILGIGIYVVAAQPRTTSEPANPAPVVAVATDTPTVQPTITKKPSSTPRPTATRKPPATKIPPTKTSSSSSVLPASVSAYVSYTRLDGKTPVTLTFKSENSLVNSRDGRTSNCHTTKNCSYHWELINGNNTISELDNTSVFSFRFLQSGYFKLDLKVCVKSVCDTESVYITIK